MSTRRRASRFDDNNNASPNSHLIGTSTSVIQKHDQGTGRLTSGTIAEILTNSTFHPRGIKVRLEDGTVGRISSGTNDNIDAYSYSNDEINTPRQSHTLSDYIMPQTSPPNQTNLPQHENEPEIVNQNEDWACSVCTFINSGLLPECELCQNIRAK